MRLAFFIAVLLVATLMSIPCAYAEADDVEAWTGVGLRTKSYYGLRLGIGEQLRFDLRERRFQGLMSDVEPACKLHDHFSIGAGYRLIHERDNDGELRRRHRRHIEAETGSSIADLNIELRVRYSEQIRAADDDGDTFRHGLRTRLKLTCEQKDFEPYVSTELFTRIIDELRSTPDKVRNTLGVSYKIGDNRIKLFYHLDTPLAENKDPIKHIAGLAYDYML